MKDNRYLLEINQLEFQITKGIAFSHHNGSWCSTINWYSRILEIATLIADIPILLFIFISYTNDARYIRHKV